jgi:hypothetical protein
MTAAAAAAAWEPFTMHLHHDGVLRSGTRRLDPREALKLHRADGELRVLEGSVWLTRSRDPADYLLERGESFHVAACDIVVIEAARTGEPTLVRWAPRGGVGGRWGAAVVRAFLAVGAAARTHRIL